MTSTLLRWIVLAALLVAVLSAPALALCDISGESGCCCTEDKKCPRPVSPEARAAACCKSSPVAPPPPAGTSDRGTESSLVLAANEEPASVAPSPPTAPTFRSNPRAEKTASGIGIYTLHAAFLI
jgi:hypothetical protein